MCITNIMVFFLFQLVRSSDKDQVTVVGAGVTLFEALSAYDTLKEKHNVTIRVIDPFTLKPIDSQLLIDSAAATGGRVVTVEDHYPEGIFISNLFLIHVMHV